MPYTLTDRSGLTLYTKLYPPLAITHIADKMNDKLQKTSALYGK